MDKDRFEQVEIKSQEELRDWLLKNHFQKESIWLITFKKSSPEIYVSTDEVLDELLSFGWIDGRRLKLDDKRTMQLVTPRKVQHWSKTYKERAKRLIDEDKMHEAGYQSIEEGKKSGLWNFLDDVDALIIPDDLKTALKEKEGAFQFFDAINDSSKRFALRWLKLSKTEKTRNKRIDELVKLSKKGEKLKGS
ncbi:YdeI/OmpD-associated family protein [Aquimarina sp. U1-2]|uniref:YdeI/OmpD-associated family protein n=1 Tax=Aquimarina sp. U1-2 TaxID=2823141 RepID=UPI001AECB236|nr:YdeI/OmpD-associated family protein [Aquimarina sp. U1-2]MBP2831089.1 YdeI/OmpD-associated family protein [Aquimarina sp. U1-2]